MDVVRLLVGGILPYIAIVVFLAAMVHRVYVWRKLPAPAMTLFPAAETNGANTINTIKEATLFSSLFRGDRLLWSFAWVFHVVLALVFVAATVAIWFRQINQVAIPEDRTLFVVFFLLGPVMGVAAFIVGTRWFGGITAVIAILLGLFMPFTVSISRQEVAENPIGVGDTIPYFVAIDDESNRVTSDSLYGTPMLIKFFRAHW